MILLLLLTLPLVIAEYPCTANFTWYRGPDNEYDGFCVSYSDDFLLDANEADAYCATMGAFAPSIHNQKLLNYWSDMTINAGVGHFWLGTSCPSEGDPYRWTDGSKTDYFGPNRELLSCLRGNGYHIHSDGFVIFARVDDPSTSKEQYSSAPALCSYPTAFYPTEEPTEPAEMSPSPEGYTDEEPVKTTVKTTPRPTTTTTRPTTTTPTTPYSPPLPDLTEGYCSCDPNTIYLDIVFVIDNSADMTKQMLGAAVAAIQSAMYGINGGQFGTGMFKSQVAVVSFASAVKIEADFGYFKSINDITYFSVELSNTKSTKMTSAIETATDMLSMNARDFTRGVIVLLSNTYNQLDDANIIEAAFAFEDDGGILITIDYSAKGDLLGLRKIASIGYNISSKSNVEDFYPQIFGALCDANCFCSDGLTPYNSDTPRLTPNGCYHAAISAAVFDAADNNCRNEQGFIATTHDTDKSFFLLTLFDKSFKYWIGYKRSNGVFKWEDNSKSTYTNWAPGNPVANKDCVYAQQTKGFDSQWFSADCRDPLYASHQYACQLRPCDSTYNCWV